MGQLLCLFGIQHWPASIVDHAFLNHEHRCSHVVLASKPVAQIQRHLAQRQLQTAHLDLGLPQRNSCEQGLCRQTHGLTVIWPEIFTVKLMVLRLSTDGFSVQLSGVPA